MGMSCSIGSELSIWLITSCGLGAGLSSWVNRPWGFAPILQVDLWNRRAKLRTEKLHTVYNVCLIPFAFSLSLGGNLSSTYFSSHRYRTTLKLKQRNVPCLYLCGDTSATWTWWSAVVQRLMGVMKEIWNRVPHKDDWGSRKIPGAALSTGNGISDSDETVRFLYGSFGWRCDIGKRRHDTPHYLIYDTVFIINRIVLFLLRGMENTTTMDGRGGDLGKGTKYF